MVSGAFDGFVWSVGEEGSDPVVTGDDGPIRHDQYEQSGHYDNLGQDLASIAGLGVEMVRYGMPWRLTEPEPGVFDWTLWDRALGGTQDAGLFDVDRVRRPAADAFTRLAATGTPAPPSTHFADFKEGSDAPPRHA